MFKRVTVFIIMLTLLSPLFLSMSAGQPVLAVGPTATLPPTIARAIQLNEQGQKLYLAGRYPEAIAAFQEALAIMKQLGYVRNEGILLSNIGAAYEAEGQYVNALGYLNQALSIAIQTGNTLGQAQTLNNLGNVFAEQGQFAKALDSYNQALPLMQRVGDRASQGTILSGIGNVYRFRGQVTKALDTYNRALTLVRQAGDRQAEGLVLGNIGVLEETLGHYAKALDSYNQALTLARQAGDRAGEGRALGNIGALYGEQGEYDKALDSLMQTLAVKREIHDLAGEAETLNNIGSVYFNLQQYDKALDWYNQALAASQQVGILGNQGTPLDNIGIVHRKQGDLDGALGFFNQALSLRRMLGDRAGEGQSLTNIGITYALQGASDKAVDYYNQALVINRATGSRVDEFSTLSNLGRLYEHLNQPADAITNYRAATAIFETILDNAGLESTIAHLLAVQDNISPYHRLAFLLAQDGQIQEAFNSAERGRAILSRAELAGKDISIHASTDQLLLQREAELRAELDSDQRTLDSLHKDVSASAHDIQAAQAALDKARQDYQTNLEAMQLRGGFIAQQLSGKVANMSQIQAAIPADTTFILYSLDEQDNVVFLVTKDSVETVTLNTTSAVIAELVKTFATDRRANADALGKLYDLVMVPIVGKLKTRHLIVAPDGVLNNIPFAALHASNGRALMDDYAISTVPSGTLLALLESRKLGGISTSPGLVLAQPSAPGLPRLAHARTEASNVAKLLGVEPILDATEEDLIQKATGSKVVHISAHTELDMRHPLFSAISFKSSPRSDGHFEVRDVYGLDLTKGTDLVVLSGCNTAVGSDGKDFGMLTQAFFAAGTQRVVASLWSVDDESTSLLMTTYMAERAKGSSDVDALRKAMLALREKFPEPYFWAGFVLSGLP